MNKKSLFKVCGYLLSGVFLIWSELPSNAFGMSEKVQQPAVGYDGLKLDANVTDEEFQQQAEFLVKKYNYDLKKIILIIKRDNPGASFQKGRLGGVSDGANLRDAYGFYLIRMKILHEVSFNIIFETEVNSNTITKVVTGRVVTGP